MDRAKSTAVRNPISVFGVVSAAVLYIKTTYSGYKSLIVSMSDHGREGIRHSWSQEVLASLFPILWRSLGGPYMAARFVWLLIPSDCILSLF